MCLFTHIAAGALVGSLSPSPVLAPVLGLGSHILLDIVPHFDFERIRDEVFFGSVVFVVLIVGGAHSLPLMLGAAFAALPDLENLLWKLGKITDEQKIFPGHSWLFTHGRTAGRVNLVAQIVLSAAAMVYLIRGIG